MKGATALSLAGLLTLGNPQAASSQTQMQGISDFNRLVESHLHLATGLTGLECRVDIGEIRYQYEIAVRLGRFVEMLKAEELKIGKRIVRDRIGEYPSLSQAWSSLEGEARIYEELGGNQAAIDVKDAKEQQCLNLQGAIVTSITHAYGGVTVESLSYLKRRGFMPW